MESTAIETIQNISDIKFLMTYVKQKSHTNIFLNYVKHLLLLRGLLEGGFSRITMLWIILIQILSYHD